MISRNAVQKCVGFLDGSLVQIAKSRGPSQRAKNIGHKEFNGLKYQAITGPDGITLNLFGPWEGRRHDMTLFRESNIEHALSGGLTIGADQYHLYADSGYDVRPYILVPFLLQTSDPDEFLFNKRIAKVRVTAEWAFKDVKTYFSHQAFPRKVVLSRVPIGKWYICTALLWNFRVALYGSPTAEYFDIEAPTLEEYTNLHM
jgi:DDE superfamily endonuclease